MRALSSLRGALEFIEQRVPTDERKANAAGIERARACLSVPVGEFVSPATIRELGFALAWAITLISENYHGPDAGLDDAYALLEQWVWTRSEN